MVLSLAYGEEKSSPGLWLTPNPYSRIIGGKRHFGLRDVRKMFVRPDLWATVLNRTSCIKITDDVTQYGFDNDYLTKTFREFLKNRVLRLAIEVYPFDHGRKVFNTDEARIYFTKAQKLGFDVNYVIASGGDASILYAIRYGGFTIDRAVRGFAGYEREVKNIYPRARVGEIFSYGDSTGYSRQEFLQILDAYKKITGKEFSLIQIEPYGTDIDKIISMARILEKRSIPYGFILHGVIHGRDEAKTNSRWQERVLSYAGRLQQYDITPDHYNIQSWVHKPDLALPETKPGTFTNTALKFIRLEIPEQLRKQE